MVFTQKNIRSTLLILGVFALLGALWFARTHGLSSLLQGRVLTTETKLEIPWRTFDPPELLSGATIPSDTHVIIHIPLEIKRIARKVLFGDQGNRIRYWGYCFPEDYDPRNIAHRAPGFPGTMFLSEAERNEREAQRQRLFPQFTIHNPPTSKELTMQQKKIKGQIRHQQEIFYGGTTCYVMTEQPLPVGSDDDNDRLNASEESANRTDPQNHDTDGDGIADGVEVHSFKTDPLRRDTDTDGLIDGIEDRNRNGKIDQGETSPFEKDSDHDGLCDGYCRIIIGGRLCSEFSTTKNCVPGVQVKWRGEDKNLNGKVDTGESNPLKTDSDGDGILDEQEHYNCLLEKKTDC
ncbi:hypothetical protein A3D88_00070 [Candidatus Peribacteria bacterium RIFCSPHIGHO2_02_FULL_52_16]|nr:MAG: hypothetical protein A2706_04915 [Candidatus Peribacteria bacterium RIFCSPHIGHO2_01_FULL_51_35]OGJ61520.1 MAG: hypothetical protein A3D88_00070 [Candidatus Peribacteria bacterium RIFCSPHIGHO2_02_FULL_52_16]